MLVTILVGQGILETCVALPWATGLLERLELSAGIPCWENRKVEALRNCFSRHCTVLRTYRNTLQNSLDPKVAHHQGWDPNLEKDCLIIHPSSPLFKPIPCLQSSLSGWDALPIMNIIHWINLCPSFYCFSGFYSNNSGINNYNCNNVPSTHNSVLSSTLTIILEASANCHSFITLHI